MSSIRLHTKIESVKHFSLTMRGAVIGLALFATLAQSSDFGTTGLIDTPTARMKPDGSLTFTLGYDQRHKQFGLTYQALPWLEMTYRYTGFEDYDYWDRNYEVKALLWEEVEYSPLPQVALGIRDAVGTGVFGAEYLVASKRFGQWDASLGVGWGRLAGKGIATNPLTYVAVNSHLEISSPGLTWVRLVVFPTRFRPYRSRLWWNTTRINTPVMSGVALQHPRAHGPLASPGKRGITLIWRCPFSTVKKLR